jgi:hypothetical protein
MPQREHQNIQGDPSPDPSVITSFDELAKGLATGAVSRRKALRWMGGALVGAALASVPGVAWANDRCSEGQTRCGDRCVNLQRSERHCGSCSNRCPEGSECVDGVPRRRLPERHHALRWPVRDQPLFRSAGFQPFHLPVRSLPAGNDHMHQRRGPWIECVLPA